MQIGCRIWAVGLLFVLYSCASDGQTAPPTSLIVQANTKFAFKLLNHVEEENPERNVMIAPTGLSLTFGLLANGSDSATQQEIESAFQFGATPLGQINEGFAGLRQQLLLDRPAPQKPTSQRKNRELPPPMVNDPNGIMIADSLWGSEYFAPPFREIARQYYRVELKKTQPSWVLSQQVSRWAMEKTGAQVPLSLGGLAKNDFLLVDVTRFHSFWLDNFEISKTKPTLFALLTGQQKPVPMMYRQGEFNYLDGPRFQAIKLRYRENFVFYVFLPSKDSNLKKLEQTITADSWRDLLKQFRSRDGLLGLPKFKVETGYDVRAALESLGLKHIFESFGALRPAVSVPEGARLNNAFQKTTLSIDEKGTEAISVGFGGGVIGGVEGGIIGVERPKPFIMIIDRPFLFAIQDVRTGALLFLGTIVEP